MDEWGLEALGLKAWMLTLGTKIGEKSDTHKIIGELGGYMFVFSNVSVGCRFVAFFPPQIRSRRRRPWP